MWRRFSAILLVGFLAGAALAPAALGQWGGLEIEPNGMGMEMDPNGMGMEMDPNGMGMEMDPNGMGMEMDPNGMGMEMDPNGLAQRGGLDIEPNG